MAVDILQALELSPQTDVTVLTVVPEHVFLGGITLQRFRGHDTKGLRKKSQEEEALELVKAPVDMLQASGIEAKPMVDWGPPSEQILKAAHMMHADLVVIGAKGTGSSSRFPLGSVAQKVMKYSDTSVLLVREKIRRIRRVLLATDGSKHSDAAVDFLLGLPLPPLSKIVLVTSLESHITALVKMPTLDIDKNRRIIAELQAAEEEEARKLIAVAQNSFQQKGYQTEPMILRGDPADEIVGVSNTINPDLIVMGAKGLNAIEHFLLGSTAQRIARFSIYSVLVVRTPKSWIS